MINDHDNDSEVAVEYPTEQSVEYTKSIEVAETQSGLEAKDLQSDQFEAGLQEILFGEERADRDETPEVAANGVEEELITNSENKSVGNTDSELNAKDGFKAEYIM